MCINVDFPFFESNKHEPKVQELGYDPKDGFREILPPLLMLPKYLWSGWLQKPRFSKHQGEKVALVKRVHM